MRSYARLQIFNHFFSNLDEVMQDHPSIFFYISL